MPTPFESEISSLLRDLGDTSLVADELLRRWKLNLLDQEEQNDCAVFLLRAGFYSSLFTRVEELCAQHARIPWAPFAEAIGRAGVATEAQQLTALLEGAREQKAEAELLASRVLDNRSSAVRELRAKIQSEKALALNARKQELREKLQFMRTNRLFQQESEVLREIQSVFPDEPEFAKERDSFEIRWAREVISNSTSVTDPTSDLAWKADRLSPEQTTTKGLMVERAKLLATENPRLAYDLAVFLHFMDFNAEAIEVLDAARPSPSDSSHATDWLRLELMLRARQYLTALDEASRMEITYAGDPESSFAIVYARARALWGLGQSTMAIDLLRSLVKIRPNYKSAQSLLMDWTGGDL